MLTESQIAKDPTTKAEEVLVDAVEIQAGREAVRMSKDALEVLSGYVDFLPLGEVTKEYFNRMIQTMSEDPEKLQVNSGLDTNFYSFNALSNIPREETPDAYLSIAVNKIVERSKEMFDMPEWPLSADDTKEFTYNWLVWHEMGHGVQAAFANSAPRNGKGSLSSPQDLSVRTIRELEPIRDTDNDDIFASGVQVIENEGFAEGFSRMLLNEWLSGKYGEEKAIIILDSMNIYRNRKAAMSKSAYEEYLASDGSSSAYTYFRENKINGSPNHIGYANSHDPMRVMEIMAKTAEWELTPEVSQVLSYV